LIKELGLQVESQCIAADGKLPGTCKQKINACGI
jgi:hypothetical protein